MTDFRVDHEGVAAFAADRVALNPFVASDLIAASGQSESVDHRSRWEVAAFLVYLLDISGQAWHRPPGFAAKSLLADAVAGPAGKGLRVVVRHRVVGPVLTLDEHPLLDDRPGRDHAASVAMLHRFATQIVEAANELVPFARRCEARFDAGASPTLRLRGPGKPITNVPSWLVAAPPKRGEKQWRDGRSAKELAKAWCREKRPSPPWELIEALGSHDRTHGFMAWDAIPEFVTPLDDEHGESRNHDLVVIGEAAGGPTLLAVEAKADESFGEETLAQALARTIVLPRSGVPRRISALVEALTGHPVDPQAGRGLPEGLADRGYQLATAAVGAAIEAGRRHCGQAVFVVHEFVGPATNPRKQVQNAADLDAFVAALSRATVARVQAGTTVGPFAIHPTRFAPAGVDLFIAKAQTVLGDRTD